MDQTSENEAIAIGRFGRPHGTRGELRLWAYNPESELFEQRQVVLDMLLHLRRAGQGFGDDIAIGKDRGAEFGFKRISRGRFIGPGGLGQRERGQDCRGAHL